MSTGYNQSSNRPQYAYRGRGFRGRGTGYYNPRQPFSTPSANPSTPSRDFTEGLLEDVVATIQVPGPGTTTSKTLGAEITDMKCIGSYSWLKDNTTEAEESNRSIIVPGSPPEWINKPTPYNVPPDTAERFIDQNGFRLPTAPLLPLIAAVDFYQATENGTVFDWSSVDIVTDRNGLRKLFRWIKAKESLSKGLQNAAVAQPFQPWKPNKDWRIDLQLAGEKTVLFSRWEQNTKELPGLPVTTYGLSFERATTKEGKGCEGTEGHHRIVQYDFGGLNIVVRFEVDAFISSAPRSKTTTTSQASTDQTFDDMLSAMSKTSITPQNEEIQTVSDGETSLKIWKAGNMSPTNSIVELATISKKRFDQSAYDWEEVAVQMLISGTPQLYLGIHDRGRFQEVKQKSFSESVELQRAEENVKSALIKLRRVLEDIKKLAVENGEDGRLSLVCTDGELKVYKRKSDDSCLPADFLDEFL
ncbi:hypothetical protein L218DRAFT_963957 [Marasmius fiardii PR-910]|nr:hypothetical protein L218DRAFT_963957 [Marasmius fiardii PR-910]